MDSTVSKPVGKTFCNFLALSLVVLADGICIPGPAQSNTDKGTGLKPRRGGEHE
jgi:hypothetical protein